MIPAAKLVDQAKDIQAILGSGFGDLTRSRFCLLTVRDADGARQWLRDLLASGQIRTIAEMTAPPDTPAVRFESAVAVAFSHAGLQALQLEESKDYPFPTAFRSGMGSPLREGILRDSARAHWRWSDIEPAPANSAAPRAVHLLVAHWWKAGKQPASLALGSAFDCVGVVRGRPSYFKGGNLYEPFGFRDGLSQPIIDGLKPEDSKRVEKERSDAGEYYADRIVAPGEFILGYRNEYDQLTYLPDMHSRTGAAMAASRHFALNGSYLAVRQIEQDVARFNALHTQTVPAPVGTGTISLGEKVMGRLREGAPLCCPVGLGMPPQGDSKNDAFRYRLEDANGMMCPPGAHIRRVNPRDALGQSVEAGRRAAKLHRLLRRGRPYRELVDGKLKEGLFFIACNADLERQFEFILQRWLHNPRFGALEDQDDPIVGAAPAARRISLPGSPTGARQDLGAYTCTLGGGYFFLPGIEALRFLSR